MWDKKDIKDQVIRRIEDLPSDDRDEIMWILLRKKIKGRVSFVEDENITIARTEMGRSPHIGFYPDCSLVYVLGDTMGDLLAEDIALRILSVVDVSRSKDDGIKFSTSFPGQLPKGFKPDIFIGD